MSSHLSYEELVDLRYGGEVEAAHLDACADCAALLERIDGERNLLKEALVQPRRRSSVRWATWTPLAAAAAALLAVLAVVMWPAVTPEETPGAGDTSRQKQEARRREAVEQAIRGIHREFGKDRFQVRDCRPFLVAAEKAESATFDELLDRHQPALTLAEEIFRQEFGETLDVRSLRDRVLIVLVFTSAERYEDWLGPNFQGMASNYPAIYRPEDRRVGVFFDGRTPEAAVLIHESIHLMVNRLTPDSVDTTRFPFWVNEGFAAYFEMAARDAGGRPCIVPAGWKERLAVLKKMIKDATDALPLVDLPTLVDQTMGEGYSGPVSYKYAAAGAFILFLRHGQAGRYRAAFDEFFAGELKDPGVKGRFWQVLKKHHPMAAPARVEQEFIEFVKGLP